ncbi:uncharacterized protein V3H82_013477 isoform 2-T2 [Fundulus diaphanus]
METTTLCAVMACLQVLPNRSQFFRYESVSFSLNCDQQGNPAAWTVKRNTSRCINSLCPSYFTGRNESTCFLRELYELDSGVYWCESEAGRSSNAINITVTDGELILESPALPVMEGEDLDLRCSTRTPLSERPLAMFFKDEFFIGSSWTGNMTLLRVSKSDEGLYKCLIPEVGESPESWLSVREAGLPESHRPLSGNIVLPVMVTSVSLFVMMLICVWRNHEDKHESSAVLYTATINKVTCRIKGPLQRGRSSVFSTVAVYTPVLRPGRVVTYKARRQDGNKGQTSIFVQKI